MPCCSSAPALNPMLITEILPFENFEFLSVITSDSGDGIILLNLKSFAQLFNLFGCFCFVYQKFYPCVSREIIDNNQDVLLSTQAFGSGWTHEINM